MTRRLAEQVIERIHEIVRLYWTTGHANYRDACRRLPIPSKVIGQPHRTGRIALHRMDSAVGRARAGRDHRPRLGRETVDPLASRDRLAGGAVRAHRSPVALVLVGLVGNRPFDHENKRTPEASFFAQVKRLEEFVAVLIGEKRIVEPDLRNTGHRAREQVFDTRLGSASHRDRVAVASKPGGDPEDIDLLDLRSRQESGSRCRLFRHEAFLFANRPQRRPLLQQPTVCGEFQFMRQLGFEIKRYSVAASDITEGLRLEEELRHDVEPVWLRPTRSKDTYI